jgi:N-acetylmuramoyl-L-alanine amidase
MFGRRVRLLGSVLLLAGVFFWFGCPTPPKQAPRVTVLDPVAHTPGPQAPAVEVVSVEEQPVLQPSRDQGAAVLPEERLHWPSGMLPLANWARLCGFNEMRVLSAAVPRMIELRAEENSLVLTAGSRNARWNGHQVGLGFAPTLSGGELALHSLDVQKNVYPLALGALPALRKERVLVIDPGHGGADPGSRGSHLSAIEKDLTLDWALRLERLLENSGWRVVLTRRADRDLPLLERVAIADSVQADLFISLHFNSLEQVGSARDESGIETYCLTPAGMPSTIKRNFEDDLRVVYPNNRFDAENLLLAMRIHSGLVKATGRRDRGVKRARFMTVLREQKRPAVLIEGGFLSNPAEASLILQPEFRQQMAQAIRDALPN